MLKKIFSIFLAVFFLFSSVALYAEDALSLDSLIQEARKSNPEILSALKRYEAAKARIPQAKSLEDPSLGITFEKTPGSPFRLQKTMPEDRMLSIAQAIPFFGKLSLKGKIALVESQMFAAEYKNKELEIINAVKNAYYDLFMNYQEIALKEESLGLLESIAKVAEAKYSVGSISQEEAFKIHGEIASLSSDIVNLREEQAAKKSLLNALINKDPENPLGAPSLSEEISFNADINSLYRLTLENKPELLIFSYAMEKNKYAKSLAKRSFFPDFIAGLVARGITSGNIGPWDLMLSFTVPIWFWSKQRYEIKEAIANLEEAEAAYQAMKNKSLAETKDLAAKVEIAKNKISLYKTNLIPILENSLEVSMTAFGAGKGDFMALLDNQRMLVETRMNYFKALVEYNMNLSDLQRNVGIVLTQYPEVKK
jgi:cobalt-zinc-cadmium efflux system outer membrane protein